MTITTTSCDLGRITDKARALTDLLYAAAAQIEAGSYLRLEAMLLLAEIAGDIEDTLNSISEAKAIKQ